MSPRRRAGVRDQAPSAFTAILQALCARTGAHLAALVDPEGETVDYAGVLDPFAARVAAAEGQLLLRSVRLPAPRWEHTEEVVVRADRASYQLVWLGEGYVLLMVLPRHCFGASRRAVAAAARELAREGCFEAPVKAGVRPRSWACIEVRTQGSDKRRPIAAKLGDQWCELEVLGRLAPHEVVEADVAYRARLKNGAELTLVREALGIWYFEEHW